MDVKRTLFSARSLGSALVLSLCVTTIIGAEEATVSDAEVSAAADAEVSSTIFISDDQPSEPPALPQSVEETAQSVAGEVVFVEDTPPKSPAVVSPANFVAPVRSEPTGELNIVSDKPQQPTLNAVRPLPKQQALAPLANQPVPLIIQQASTDEPVAQPSERDQPGDIQIAVHAEPLAARPPQRAAIKSYEQLLISAHEISQQAEALGDYTQIIDSCAEALRQGAKAEKAQFGRHLSSWALNRRGQLHAEAGKQELADADFHAALELNPRNWRAMHNRGVSYAQAGQLAEAFDDFNTVTQLNPRYAKAYANRATLYVQAKDLQAAIKDYEQAIQRDDKFASAYVGLGRVCHMLGRWDEAIEHFSTAIELEPASADIVCSRGDLQADMGHYGEALTDYAKTIELDPEFAHAYRNGAWLLATCPDQEYRDPENAILGAQQALEYSYGDRHVALDTLAAALASNGQFEEAIATLTEAVDLAPQDAKFTYLSRLQLYQNNEPFRTEPVGDVSQVVYEASDK